MFNVTDSMPAATDQLTDQPFSYPVSESILAWQGRIFDVVADTVDLGAQGAVPREYVQHPGAVAIVALDEAGQVALVNQYRHPVREILWEFPAGLLDIGGESGLAAAKRELAEEADLTATDWHVLVDLYTSPGGTNEALRIYLARGLSSTKTKFARFDEEATMQVRWLSLDDVVAGVQAGRLHNPTTVVGALATSAARQTNWATLRPADAPWAARPAWQSPHSPARPA